MKSDGAPSRAPLSHAPSSCRPTSARSPASTTPSGSRADARERLAVKIRERAVTFGIGAASVREIDRHQHLSRDGDRDAPRARAPHRDAEPRARSTASRSARSRRPHTAIVGGDDKCYTIACASILAKVTRDRLMHALARPLSELSLGDGTSATRRRRISQVLGDARPHAAPPALVHAGAASCRSTSAPASRTSAPARRTGVEVDVAALTMLVEADLDSSPAELR